MKGIEIVRRIRGNLHGSVDVSQFEDWVIDHPAFQRLRRIRQTAMLNLVFPGATHTRFEHSLGVMDQASMAWQRLRENQLLLRTDAEHYTQFAARELDTEEVHGLLSPAFHSLEFFDNPYIFQTLRLAGLLHDLGHPPFSHSGERFLPPISEILALDLPKYLQNYLEQLVVKKGSNAFRVSHEVVTLVLIERVITAVCREHPEFALPIKAQDIAAILCPDIEPALGSPLWEHRIYLLLHQLVSGEVDIDRMDYLLRDSRECGVVYGIFDLDRILDSLVIYAAPNAKEFHLAIQYSGLAAFEDYLRARQSMYLQLYFHKASVACEAMLQAVGRIVPQWTLPADPVAYLNIDEGNVRPLIENAARECSAEQRQKLGELLDGMTVNRSLWKRVFEVTSHKGDHEDLERQVQEACAILDRHKIPYETISSRVALTNFKKRAAGMVNRELLRLVKKDEKQFPRVVPIEDYSHMIKQQNTIEIRRIYVPQSRTPDGLAWAQMAREALLG